MNITRKANPKDYSIEEIVKHLTALKDRRVLDCDIASEKANWLYAHTPASESEAKCAFMQFREALRGTYGLYYPEELRKYGESVVKILRDGLNALMCECYTEKTVNALMSL